MIIRGKDRHGGIKEYLEKGQAKDRHFSRDELDSRLILNGNLNLLDQIIEGIPDSQNNRYFHMTLSFKEDYLPEETLQAIDKEFREFISQGYGDNEIYIYSEAHLPKIKNYLDKKSKLIERKPHIHVVIPQINLLTGKELWLNYKWMQSYRDSFQEYINQKYGLASPKDNRREFNQYHEIISRYKGDIFNGRNVEIKSKILEDMLARNINNLSSFNAYLQNELKAQVKYVNGKESNYFSILLPGEIKHTRLKDSVFAPEFIVASNEEKQEHLNNIKHNSLNYIDIGEGRVVDQDYLAKLDEWRKVKALEQKYWRENFSKRDKLKYQLMDQIQQEQFLNKKAQKFYTKYGVDYEQQITTGNGEFRASLDEYYRAIKLNLEHAQSILEQSGIIVERIVGTEIDADTVRQAARQARNRRRDTERMSEHSAGTDTNGRQTGYDNRASEPLDIDKSFRSNRTNQASTRCSSILEHLDMNIENDEWIRNSKNINQVKDTLEANTVLELASKTHGVIPEKYMVIKNKTGEDRIVCGNRQYNVVDFVFKELNLSWEETKDLLSIANKMQKDVNRSRGYSLLNPGYLWDGYNQWLNKKRSEKSGNKLEISNELKQQLNSSNKKYKNELHELYKLYKKHPLELAIAKQELLKNKKLRDHNIRAEADHNRRKVNSQPFLYREYLRELAEAGDGKALAELRRLSLDYEDKQFQGRIQAFRYYEYRMKLPMQIDIWGTKTYSIGDKEIIRDYGHKIDIVNTDKNSIGYAVELARKKWGNKIELNGGEEFRKLFVEHCINHKIDIQFLDKYSNEYSSTAKALKEAELNQKTSSEPILFKDQILVDVITDGTQVKVILADKNSLQTQELTGSHLKSLDKLPRGALIDFMIKETNQDKHILTKVTDINYLRSKNKQDNWYSVIEPQKDGKVICQIGSQPLVVACNKELIPGDKVKVKLHIVDQSLLVAASKVEVLPKHQEFKQMLLKTDAEKAFNSSTSGNPQNEFKTYGRYIKSGRALNKFYNKESFYILIQAEDGKLKQIWNSKLEPLVNDYLSNNPSNQRYIAITKFQSEFKIIPIGQNLAERMTNITQAKSAPDQEQRMPE